jgi:hypothetical protein
MAEYMAILWAVTVVLVIIVFSVPWGRFWKK